MGLAAASSGCGADTALANEAIRSAGSEPSAKPYTTNEIVLDWTGGHSRIHPEIAFPGLDLRRFPVTEGGTLADRADAFRAAVADEVQRILSGVDDLSIRIREGESDEAAGATVVYLTQHMAPQGGTEAGEGEYDPCDAEPNNQALVFAETLRRVVGICTWDEWVRVFANVAAHEVGHTLGFEHVAREPESDSARRLYIELMLDGHTAEELRREQRVLAEWPVCSSDKSAG